MRVNDRRLTGLLSLCLYSYTCLMRGASRGVLEVRQVRCPRAGDERNPPKLPGGAGAPPAGTMTCREELADGRAFRPARGAKVRLPKRGRAGTPKAGRLGRRKRGPDAVTTPHGAPRGARVPLKEERGKIRTWCAARRSIPLSFCEGARNRTTAYPAPQRIGAISHARLRTRLRRAAFASDGLPAEAPKERRLAYPAPQRIGAMALGCLRFESVANNPLVPAEAGTQRFGGHEQKVLDARWSLPPRRRGRA